MHSYNEHLRLPERHLQFNPDELRLIVSKSVGQPTTNIVSFTKIAEGGSYRIFEATFRDGLKVIARLPYRCTIPHTYGVASEVATMAFLRLHGIPVPKVLDWSSSSSNTIGSEYIIMERVPGKELEETWYTLSVKERMSMMGKIVAVEKKLFDLKFPAYGSIYYKESLGPEFSGIDMTSDSSIDLSRFCIGPSTEYLWWYNQRKELPASKGPWRTPEEVLRAVGERELLWLKQYGAPRLPREPLYREFYGGRKVGPWLQMSFLEDYLKVVPLIVPKEDTLNAPCFRHPDLSPNNIFVSSSGEITGVIDWQHATVLPIFLQAKIPKHFQNYGDEDSENFRDPELPSNFKSLTEDEKQEEMERYRRRQVHYFYIGFTSKVNKPHFHAMGKYHLVLRNQLYDIAGRPWEGDNTSLQAQLIKTLEHWSDFDKDGLLSPPISYSESDITSCLDRDSKQKAADAQMQQIRDFIGVNIDGWLPLDSFDTAKEKSKILKNEMLQSAENEEERRDLLENWPLQDHEEID